MAQQKTMTKCPECGAKVAKDKLKGHIERVHRTSLKTAKDDSKEEPLKRPSAKGKKRKLKVPWRIAAIIIVLSLVSVGVYAIVTRATVATVVTNYGTFKIQLYTDKAPNTAKNFIDLAKQGFYDGLKFHRIVHNFVIQGGDPKGDGSGGSENTVDWEKTGLKNTQYTVAMARSGDPNTAAGANTATSQFFVNLVDNPSLDGYTYPFVVFGRVIEGMDVVDTIGRVETGANDVPVSPVFMNSVTIS